MLDIRYEIFQSDAPLSLKLRALFWVPCYLAENIADYKENKRLISYPTLTSIIQAIRVNIEYVNNPFFLAVIEDVGVEPVGHGCYDIHDASGREKMEVRLADLPTLLPGLQAVEGNFGHTVYAAYFYNEEISYLVRVEKGVSGGKRTPRETFSLLETILRPLPVPA